jgi:TRAP-type C4-dicarboxylate transport system permease small subunit
MGRSMEWLSHWCAQVTKVLMLILGNLLVICLLIGVFFRYVVGYALSFPEELSMLLFTWVVFLTGSLGVREAFHARLTFVLNRFPPPAQKMLSLLITALIISFGAILLYSGKEMVTRTSGSVSAVMGYPLSLINSSAIVSGALIMIHGLRNLMMPEKED